MGRTYRRLARELGLALAPTEPAAFVPRFASDLDLPASVLSEAERIVRSADRDGLFVGKSPAGIAGAALYVAARAVGPARTQARVAEAAGVTAVTIRHRVRELEAAGLVPEPEAS